MDAKNLRDKLVGSDDKRAVSPVIGVILMVAITVILAAVIATLVMDLNPASDTTPTATWENSEGADIDSLSSSSGAGQEVVVFEHISGDQIDASNLEVAVSSNDDWYQVSASGQITSGETVAIETTSSVSTGTISEGTEFTLTWNDGDSSAQFATFTLSEDKTVS